ncbi:MAG: hypothetical protein IJQ65_08910 [Kiritimatiellae bacterium]|nr:hypothetical protein [Kiritimatiellia bacterium]
MAKYMVVDLSKGKNGPFPISYYEDVPDFPGVERGKWDDYHKTTNLVLRLIWGLNISMLPNVWKSAK